MADTPTPENIHAGLQAIRDDVQIRLNELAKFAAQAGVEMTVVSFPLTAANPGLVVLSNHTIQLKQRI